MSELSERGRRGEETYALFWKALTAFVKRPAPMRRMKLDMTTKNTVSAGVDSK